MVNPESHHRKRCPVGECAYATTTGLQTDLIKHAASNHPELAVFSCPRCDYFAASIYGRCLSLLRPHLARKHGMSEEQIRECFRNWRNSPAAREQATSSEVCNVIYTYKALCQLVSESRLTTPKLPARF
jgi:hypothetical protein